MCKWHLNLSERFAERFLPVTESGCWIWTGNISSSGYGTIRYKNKMWQAHRASWTIFRGEIPLEICVLHSCDIKSCVNPDHLFLGDHQTNAIDMVNKGRAARTDGIHNGRAKLSVEQVLAIRNSQRTCRELAQQYGTGMTIISAIKRRELWKHL